MFVSLPDLPKGGDVRRIGIDLGGTKIEGLLLDDAGCIVRRLRVDTPKGDYSGTLRTIADVVARLDAPDASIGVAAPGSASRQMDADGRTLWKGANSTWLNGRPLQHDLAQTLERPLRIANDANCFAVSEAHDGAAAAADVVFGVIIGTGVGGGIVVGGSPVHGYNGISGEWGHVPLPWMAAEEFPGPPCFCGRRGCIETFCSGPAFRHDHEQAGGDPRLRGTEIAASTDSTAVAAFERYVSRLGRALAMVVNLLDPNIIVIGGGLSNIDALYERLPPVVAAHVFSTTFDTPIVKNRHGDSSGVRGAAWLWQ